VSRRVTTTDGVVVSEGDRAFNYYDHKPGAVGRVDDRPQPDTLRGQDSSTPAGEWSNHWFRFEHDDGTSTHLDGSRVCSEEHARRQGWID
jgi:hypothetical protein